MVPKIKENKRDINWTCHQLSGNERSEISLTKNRIESLPASLLQNLPPTRVHIFKKENETK